MVRSRLGRFILVFVVLTFLTGLPFSGRLLAQATHMAIRPSQPRAGASQAETVQLAVAIQGNIYVLLADGGLRRLAGSGDASMPVLSPDGRWVAYLVSSHRLPVGLKGPYAVWIVPTAGKPGVMPRMISDTRLGTDDYTISWSPDSRALAYFEGKNIVVRVIAGAGSQTTLQPLPGFAFATFLDWSPSGQFVVPLMQLGLGASQAPPPFLQAAVYDLRAHRWTRVTARFAPGALGQWPEAPHPASAGLVPAIRPQPEALEEQP